MIKVIRRLKNILPSVFVTLGLTALGLAFWGNTTILLTNDAQAKVADGTVRKADNFVLIDHQGKAQELYYHRDAKAVVIMVHGNGCQIVRSNLDEFKQLRDDYQKLGVEFLMINANNQDTRQAIADEALEWGVDMPILQDKAQLVAASLGLVRTGEVLVIEPGSWNIVYRGALSDRVDYERQKAKSTKHYVKDALDSVLAGKPIELAQVLSPGCIINFDAVPSDISYSETIAPILKENCVACHVEGGIAPWAMSQYAMIKGFAPMIREVLRTKRMPPWHADPEVGHWANDQAISEQDLKSLIHWIEDGAPRGEGEDPLLAVPVLESSWTLGEPDLIIDIPAYEVPASGIVDYKFPTVPNPLDKDVWIVAAAIIPGDPNAVHHILAGSSARAELEEDIGDIFENFILTYAPGNASGHMPEGTGVFVPKGGVYQFQLHYTPYGKKTTDRSKLGLYFADKPPKNFLREQVMANQSISIPANVDRHEEHAYFEFWEDATIYTLFPHSHYRGRSSDFKLIYPDGKTETILSVPNYDFNWQRSYRLAEPKQVPAGTRILHSTIYDNSSKNLGNPDPSAVITWGLQSEEEMLYGSMSYSWDNETSSKPINKPGLNRILQIMGAWDQNMDSKVSPSELPSRMQSKLGANWAKFDLDDNGLDLKELGELLKGVGSEI